MMEGRFTIVSHALLDSDAYRLLSPGAAVSLIEFLRRWEYASRGGLTPRSVVFSWTTSSSQIVARSTWRRQRDELLRKGFLKAVNAKLATYRPSDAWSRYEPSANEQAAMERQCEAKAKRGVAIIEMRGPKEDETLPQKEEKLEAQGVSELTPANGSVGGLKLRPLGVSNRDPGVGSQIETPIHTIPPTTSLPPPTKNENPLALRHTTARSITLLGLTTDVWPPDMHQLTTSKRFVAWADTVWEYWNADEDAEAKRLIQALDTRNQARSNQDPVDAALYALRTTLDESAYIVRIAKLLGNSDAPSRERVRRVYNQAGPEAIAHAARELIADSTATVPKRFQWLAYRAGLTGAH